MSSVKEDKQMVCSLSVIMIVSYGRDYFTDQPLSSEGQELTGQMSVSADTLTFSNL